MTTLALRHNDSVFDRMDAPAAGAEAYSLTRFLWDELARLRTRTARSSWVFDDLETLAREQNTTVQQSDLFQLAKRFLLVLPTDATPPELDLGTQGEILFDWSVTRDRMMTIALRADGQISFAARFSSSKKRHGCDLFQDAIPPEIIELVRAITRR